MSLLPCPLCGSPATLRSDMVDMVARVGCTGCGAAVHSPGGEGRTAAELQGQERLAVEAWNTRAPSEHYSRALDEIWRLRALLAYEATQTAERLRYRTLPMAVRISLMSAGARASLAARGKSAEVCRPLDDLQARLCEVGANPGLTREQWEAEAK